MAAISGVLRFDDAPVAALGKRIATRMSHRSPDGIRLWDRGATALGFDALHANVEAAFESQPLDLEDGAVLVVDGWVQDRPGLVHALGIASERLATMGDGRLLAWA